ncbi:MAG: GAF domain-containing sensor histidine kinase [Oligoflexia bacterium]|nr:GAF domain-containing sensor histidine kinase [Oligoflexia bacterium]
MDTFKSRIEQLEAELREHSLREARLLSVIEKINSGLSLDEVLEHVFSSFHGLIPFDRIGVALIDEKAGTVHAHWAKSRGIELKMSRGYSAPLAGSSLQQVLETGEPRVLNDLEEYLREHPASHSTRLIVEEGLRSSLTCPLFAMDRPVGFIFFSSSRKNAYSCNHTEIFQQLSGTLSGAIERGRLYQELYEAKLLRERLSRIISHELKNALWVIQTGVAVLKRFAEGLLPAKRAQVLSSMSNGCETMNRLIDDLVEFDLACAGRLTISPKSVDLRELLDQAAHSGQLLAKRKNIELKVDVPGSLPKVELDPLRIGQVLSNLLSNAAKFSTPGSFVCLSAEPDGSTVRIAVSDNGPGIPAAEVPKLFQEFGKTSIRPTGGERSTGLGLLVSRHLVEAHHGTIGVETAPGRGTKVTVVLPLRQAEAG